MTSRSAAGRNAIATQATHARWVESARWRVWGKIPTLKAATARSTRGLIDDRSRRTAHTPITASATTEAVSKKKNRLIWAGPAMVGMGQRSLSRSTTICTALLK